MRILLVIMAFLLSNNYEWKVVSNNGPEPRYINQMVYANNSLLLFGGKNNGNKGFNDLWEWKEGQWNLLGKGATKRWDHSYVYMEHYDQLFMFGGRCFKNIQGKEERVDIDDNWIYKNGKWEMLEIISPAPRSSHSMVYNKKSQKVILFGGRNKDEIFGDTWSFDGEKWNQLEITGPSKRYGHTLTYNSVSKTMYLFGGFDGEKLLNDFWVFDGENWTELECETKPSPRMAHAMHFDSKGNAVLFGGWDDSNSVSGELWIWSDNEWKLCDAKQAPQARLSSAIGYDRSKDEFILFGGSTGFDGQFLPETWKLILTKT